MLWLGVIDLPAQSGTAKGTAKDQTVTFNFPITLPLPPANAAVIPLAAADSGYQILRSSPEGIVLLGNGQSYARWQQGQLTVLFPTQPSVNDAFNSPDGQYSSRSLYEENFWMSRNGNVVVSRHAEEYESRYNRTDWTDRFENTVVTDALDYALVSGATSTYRPDRYRWTQLWDGYLWPLNYDLSEVTAYGIDDGGVAWVRLVSDYSTSDRGAGLAYRLNYGLMKLDLATGQKILTDFDDVYEVNSHGVAIGHAADGYHVGDRVVDYQPIFINDNATVYGVASNGQEKVYFADGRTAVAPAAVWCYFLDDQDRLHGWEASDPAVPNTYDRPTVWTLKRNPDGKLVDPPVYERSSYQPINLPAGWTTTLQAPPGHWTFVTDNVTQTDSHGVQTTVPVLMVSACLGVDADRDGTIRLAGEDSSDATSADKPFRFWINDDDDVDTANPDNAENAPISTPDWTDGKIDGIRDLEDFARLKIYLDGLQDAIVQGQIQVGLKWKDTTGSPSLKVWRNLSPDGGREYLTDAAVAQQHLALRNPGLVQGTTPYIIPVQYWQDIGLSASQPYGNLLFEGCTAGKGQLVITLHKADGTVIGEGPGVWLDLKNIKSMYERVKALADGGDNIAIPSDFTGPDDNNIPQPVMSWTTNPNGYPFQPGQDESRTYTIFVHGWNQTYERSIMYAETMFKRMWHRGYKGRFVAFRWPTFTGLTTYNDSEYRAWKCGVSLKQYLETIPRGAGGYTVNLVAHSMGNIVAGEALKRGAIVTNYALWNAAVPACCYDGSASLDQGWGYTHPNDDPDSYTRTLAYQERLAGVSGSLINFFLPRDDALKKWELNNSTFKPQRFNALTTGYGYDRAAASGHKLFITFVMALGRYMVDPHESMAYAVQSQTLTVGADGRTAGVIQVTVPLEDFGFDDVHSAEFLFPAQQTKGLYNRLLRSFQIEPVP